MRNFTIILFFTFLSQLTYSQLNITTEVKQEFTWDYKKSEWKFKKIDKNYLMFFEFHETIFDGVNTFNRMFKHTNSNIKTHYYIRSFKRDQENNRYVYMVVDDEGVEFKMIIDAKNDNIRFVSQNGNYMTRYPVISYFIDD